MKTKAKKSNKQVYKFYKLQKAVKVFANENPFIQTYKIVRIPFTF